MRRRRTGSKTKKKMVPILYEAHGVTVRHVDMAADRLPGEIARLLAVATDALRLLRRLPSHPLLLQAKYKLDRALLSSVTPDTIEQQTQEIGRLNLVLNEALTVLDRMRSTFEELEAVRFCLRYGQTSKKREAGWNSFKRDRESEYIGDPEIPIEDISDYD